MTSDQLERQIRQQPRTGVDKVMVATNDVLLRQLSREQVLEQAHLASRWGTLWPIEWAIRVQVDDSWKRDGR